MRPPDLRPIDFSLRYRWRAGSMPPPHHYSVSAEIHLDGSGTATLKPDYAGKDVPTWSLPFQLTSEALDILYTVLRQEGLFADDWLDPERRRVGGSLWSVRATANGHEFEVTGLQRSETVDSPKPIREAIWEAVPKHIRDELANRRKGYVTDYRKRS